MKYYDEDQMQGVRRVLEAEVLKWPEVRGKQMMGCLCYFRGKRFFAFLVTNGIVITKLAKEDRLALTQITGSGPFEMAGKKSSTWVLTPLKGPEALQPLMPYVRKSYEAAAAL